MTGRIPNLSSKGLIGPYGKRKKPLQQSTRRGWDFTHRFPLVKTKTITGSLLLLPFNITRRSKKEGLSCFQNPVHTDRRYTFLLA